MRNLACPKCVGPLRFGAELPGPIGTCYDCWGLWIDVQQLNAIEDYAVGGALYRASRELDPRDAESTDLLCPSCEDGKLVLQKIRGVELEWCTDCRGIFLDKGERQRLVGSLTERKVSPPPGPAPALFKTGSPPSGLGGVAVGEVLAGLAELLFTALD